MGLIDTLAEAQIRAAAERGEFDGLPGLGKPIPDLDAPYDELWWVRKWMEREGVDLVRELEAEGIDPGRVALLERIDERRRGRR